MTPRTLRGVTLLVPAVIIAAGGWAHRWMNEDAYINLRVVDQIFAGHGPVFNAGERIEAATSPLWILVLVVGRALTGWFLRAEWIAVLASLLAAVVAFVVAGRAARLLHPDDEDGLVVPVGLLLVSAVAVVWDFSTSGLEMGLVWLWIATSWHVLLAAARTDEVAGRRRLASAAVLGLAPLIRPELTLMAVCFAAAWFVLVRPRRVALDLVAILALPVAYEIFRMGYYASLVPNTALAKDAGGLHAAQGWSYARDLIDAYHLWVSGLLVAGALGLRHWRQRDRAAGVATVAVLAGGLLDAVYIVAVGGDYMHGRLLLPALFALGLPATVVVRRAWWPGLALAGGAVTWAIVSVVAFRPPPPPYGFVVAQVSDWRAISGGKVVLDDFQGVGLSGHQAAALYDQGVRGYFQVLSVEPLPGADPELFVLTLGSIGVPAYNAGREVWVIDIGGLAEPLAARTAVVPGRPAGHRKQVDLTWYDARFLAPSASDTVQVVAARRVLEDCGPVSDLMDAVNEDLTPGRFLSNIWHSVSFTRLHIPADPLEAERRFCPPG